ncbi:MAG: hypothetical protein WBV33_17070, partial [Terracidiphilus sp.]
LESSTTRAGFGCPTRSRAIALTVFAAEKTPGFLFAINHRPYVPSPLPILAQKGKKCRKSHKPAWQKQGSNRSVSRSLDLSCHAFPPLSENGQSLHLLLLSATIHYTSPF